MRTLIIDNYDSFTFNLVQYVGELGGNPEVFKNNEISLSEIGEKNYSHIIISPGPGHPADPAYFGIGKEVILELGKRTPLLGVCLGHQGIGLAFGGKVIHAPQGIHGKTCQIRHNGKEIFANLENPCTVMRYHSLIIDRASLPDCLEVSAESLPDELIMAVKHREFPIWGIQFHPESIGTPNGKMIIRNFLNQTFSA